MSAKVVYIDIPEEDANEIDLVGKNKGYKAFRSIFDQYKLIGSVPDSALSLLGLPQYISDEMAFDHFTDDRIRANAAWVTQKYQHDILNYCIGRIIHAVEHIELLAQYCRPNNAAVNHKIINNLSTHFEVIGDMSNACDGVFVLLKGQTYEHDVEKKRDQLATLYDEASGIVKEYKAMTEANFPSDVGDDLNQRFSENCKQNMAAIIGHIDLKMSRAKRYLGQIYMADLLQKKKKGTLGEDSVSAFKKDAIEFCEETFKFLDAMLPVAESYLNVSVYVIEPRGGFFLIEPSAKI